ncbi:MAG: hypothetical protein R2704_08435 [Microthrixaceae bacterium]
MTHPIGRRRFLVATAAVGGVSAVAGCADDGTDDPAPDGSTDDGALPAGLAAIGGGYLEANPKLTEAELVEGLPAGVDGTAPPTLQLDQAAEAIAADFGADRVERVNGWWLSTTEARICALGVMRA